MVVIFDFWIRQKPWIFFSFFIVIQNLKYLETNKRQKDSATNFSSKKNSMVAQSKQTPLVIIEYYKNLFKGRRKKHEIEINICVMIYALPPAEIKKKYFWVFIVW